MNISRIKKIAFLLRFEDIGLVKKVEARMEEQKVFLKVQKIKPGVSIKLLVHQKVGGILMLLKKTEKQRIHYQ